MVFLNDCTKTGSGYQHLAQPLSDVCRRSVGLGLVAAEVRRPNDLAIKNHGLRDIDALLVDGQS